MRIIELKLENIKTYENETINFSDGINCILGLNGSGKTTIIESIGYVLFNYSNKTNSELLRYNESKGSIAVTFEGKDSNIYKIVRTVRTKNASVKILDNLNHVLYENVSDVYEFVKKILGVPKEKSLSKIYEEIIAVPQGYFVNAFLETPRNRKDNFDKLFELDIYKILADKTKVLNDKIEKEYISVLEKESAQLEGQLVNYDLLIKQIDEVQAAQVVLREKLVNAEDIYNKKKEEKELIENKQKTYISKENEKALLEKTIQTNEVVLQELVKQLEAAKKASDIISKTEFGYKRYLLTAKTLQENKVNQDKYISIEKEIRENEVKIKTSEEKIKVLSESIHSLKLSLGRNKENIIEKKKLIEEKTNEKAILDEKIGPLRTQINEATDLSTQLYAKKNLKLQILKGAKEYIVLTFNNLKNKDLDSKLSDIKLKLKDIEEKKEKLHLLEKEKITVDNSLNNLINNKKFMEDGQCPILKQKCLNINNSSLSSELEKLIETEEEKLVNLNSQINLLILEVAGENKLLKEKEYIEFEKNSYLVDREKYKSIMKDIVNNFQEEFDEINEENDVEIIEKLIYKYENEATNEDEKNLSSLREEILKVQTDKSAIEGLITINMFAINSLEKENQDLISEIQKQENEVDKEENKVSLLEKNNKEIEAILERYLNIQKEIEENEATLVKLQKDYEDYILNVKEANLYEDYKAKCKDAEENFANQKNTLNELVLFLNNIENKVDEDSIEVAREELMTLSNQISSDKTTLNINNQNLIKLSEEKQKLDILKDKQNDVKKLLESYSKLLGKNKLFREIFTILPRELSKQIRKYVSTLATNIYRKISNENVRIDISDDYEVIIIDCIDDTKKKSILQLSGGEQMSLAISIRLAMLKQITNIEFYFMDEPTINLDYERRMMVSEVVKDISDEITQMFVISHDDTFETITDNIIKIEKRGNVSQLVE